jgi:hypothetical protein
MIDAPNFAQEFPPPSMERFRLKSATMAVSHPTDDTKGSAIIIPAGSEVASIDAIDTRSGLDHSHFVPVKWAGQRVHMLLLDLVERGERIIGK